MSRRVIYPLINLSSEQQFKHVIYNFVHDLLKGSSKIGWETYQKGTPVVMHTESRDEGNDQTSQDGAPEVILTDTGLRKVKPYWYNYTTMAKGRWLGREILEIISTEFRDRSMEYYVRFSSSLSELVNEPTVKDRDMHWNLV